MVVLYVGFRKTRRKVEVALSIVVPLMHRMVDVCRWGIAGKQALRIDALESGYIAFLGVAEDLRASSFMIGLPRMLMARRRHTWCVASRLFALVAEARTNTASRFFAMLVTPQICSFAIREAVLIIADVAYAIFGVCAAAGRRWTW